MILINYPNIIRVGERSLIIIIGLVYIYLYREVKSKRRNKILFPKEREYREKKTRRFLEFS